MSLAPLVARALLLIAGALLASGGCASLRKYKPAPDSLATCRTLSRDGVAALERGECQTACDLLHEAVETNPSDIDARRQLAEALWQRREYAAAADMIESAVRLDPQNAPTLVRAGEMLRETGVTVSAMQRAEQAIALDGTLASAWALRGRLYRGQSQPERALADLHQALRYSPHDQTVLLDVAELQYQLGRPQRCLATVHHLLDSYGPGDEPQRGLWLEGLAYSAVERPGDAAASFYAASNRGAPNADLLFQLAKAEAEAGRPQAAANSVRRALALDAGHQQSRVLLAQLTDGTTPAPDGVIRR
ncbi:MAG: tetratricopeptide repeat protein [Planctomycetales bacterium]|nr:tetratricopeptide repeat protein [Planctomycetales bacterium]